MATTESDVNRAHRERRRYRRARPGWRAAVGFIDDPDLVPATVEDVSIGGASLSTRLNATPGNNVVVVLTSDEGTVPVLGTVVDQITSGTSEPRLHIAFVWLSEANRTRIAAATGDPA